MSVIPILDLTGVAKQKLTEREILNKLDEKLQVKPDHPEYESSFNEIRDLVLEYIQRRVKKKRKQKLFERMDVLLFIASKYDNKFWMTFAVKHGGHDKYYYNRYQLIEGELIDAHEGCSTEEEKELCEKAILNCSTVEEARENSTQARLNFFLINTNLEIIYDDE